MGLINDQSINQLIIFSLLTYKIKKTSSFKSVFPHFYLILQ